MTDKAQIDWDGIAAGLQTIFNQSMDSYKKGWGGVDQAIEAAKALTQVAAEVRAEREAADKDKFKISKP